MSASDEFLAIDTPENVVFSYEVAGIGSRFLAALIDSLLIAFLLALAFLTLFLLMVSGLGQSLGEAASSGPSWLLAIFGLISFAILWGYYILFELLWNGQSPGKRRLGLRVIRSDGTPIGPSEAVIRNLVRIVDFLPLYYGIGVVTMFLNDQARRLGDLAAGTLVVYDRGTVSLDSLRTTTFERAVVPQTGRPAMAGSLAGLPLDRLSAPDVAAAESFLQRRHQFADSRAIGHRLAHTFLEKMDATERRLEEGDVLALIRLVAARSGQDDHPS